MISLKSFSHRWLPAAFICLILCAGCAAPRKTPPVAADRGTYRIAILPIENLSGGKAPLKELRQVLVEKVRTAGFDVLPEDALNHFLARHRIRYVGGIDAESAADFAREEGVKAVLVSSLEYYSGSFPPKITLTARLVSTDKEPEILWMDNAALSGDDAPGVFELGMVRDAQELAAKALRQLVDSLSGGYSAGFREMVATPQRTFRPRLFYRSDLAPEKRFRIVVLPFYNRSGRKYAGEIMALRFVQELRRLGNFRVIEPGVVRHRLLQFRLIMAEGVSLANADVIYDALESNLVLTGKVLDYEEARGENGIATVDFSTTVMDKENRMQVLSANSYYAGNDRVVFFDFGRISTACGVATEMVRGIVQKIGPMGAVSASGK